MTDANQGVYLDHPRREDTPFLREDSPLHLVGGIHLEDHVLLQEDCLILDEDLGHIRLVDHHLPYGVGCVPLFVVNLQCLYGADHHHLYNIVDHHHLFGVVDHHHQFDVVDLHHLLVDEDLHLFGAVDLLHQYGAVDLLHPCIIGHHHPQGVYLPLLCNGGISGLHWHRIGLLLQLGTGHPCLAT